MNVKFYKIFVVCLFFFACAKNDEVEIQKVYDTVKIYDRISIYDTVNVNIDVYDTVKIYDRIPIYDTVNVNINVYDTSYIERYIPKEHSYFQKSFYAAHALGRIDGYDYTNSKEAFEQSYAAGYRVFEVMLN